MKVNGIVAEYNPFHNGHAYQLQHAKEANDANYTIIVMSGNFMQRGAPALLDKFTRTKMALENGADLVLELPTRYAASSAEFFAKAARVRFASRWSHWPWIFSASSPSSLAQAGVRCWGMMCSMVYSPLSRRL